MFDILDYGLAKGLPYVPHFTVTISACLLFIIGSFKSAAISPPLGVNLDTQDDYISISTFYSSNQDDDIVFRALDAFWTTLIEVISAAAFYGAWGTGELMLGRNNDDRTTYWNGLIGLAQAHILSLVAYIAQYFYLYLHYKSQADCIIRECKDLLYAVILVISLFATSAYIRGWWEILDLLSFRYIPSYTNLELVCSFLLGFVVMILMGTASYNHFGVSREGLREKEGILLPFFYLTYYLRDREDEVETKVFKAHDAKFFNLLKKWNQAKKSSKNDSIKAEVKSQNQTDEEKPNNISTVED